MANNLQAFARLLSSIPDFKDEDGTLLPSSMILGYYQMTEKTAQSELFISNPVLGKLKSLCGFQQQYDGGYFLYKDIAFKLDQLHDLKYF